MTSQSLLHRFFILSVFVGVLLNPAWAEESAGLAKEIPKAILPEIMDLQKEISKLKDNQFDMQKALHSKTGLAPEDMQKLSSLSSEIAELKKTKEELARQFTELSQSNAAPEAPTANEEMFTKVSQAWLGTNAVWVLMAGFLVMLMQAGFALVETGLTRAKNAAHTMTMNLMDYCIGMLAFWAFGFALMFGNIQSNPGLGITEEAGLNKALSFDVGETTYSFFGASGWFPGGEMLTVGGVFTLFLFQMVFAGTANTIPTGTLAERWKIKGFVLHSIFVAGILYPIFGHWVWGGGWLSKLGYWDFAGSTVVHMAGGVMALVGAYVVGARLGKFNSDGSSNPIPGHNLPFTFIGTFILAFGWFGFNAGSTLLGTDSHIGVIATNTALASAAGACAACILTKLKFGRVDPSFACNGMLAGLVGVTAPCAYIDTWAAVVVGIVSGVLVVYSAIFVEEKLKLDDPVGAISVHGACGAFGGIAVGLFANGKYGGVMGLFYGNPNQLMIQILGVVVCFLFFGFFGYLMFMFTSRIVGNRSSDVEQLAGLDLEEFGVEAYGKDPLSSK
jgi:ammonium transporter, Amt family